MRQRQRLAHVLLRSCPSHPALALHTYILQYAISAFRAVSMAVPGGGVPWTDDRSWSMVVSERASAALRQSPWIQLSSRSALKL